MFIEENVSFSSSVRQWRRLIHLLYRTMMSVSLLFLPNNGKRCSTVIAKKSFQTWKLSSVRLWCSAIYTSSKLHIIISLSLLAIHDLYFQALLFTRSIDFYFIFLFKLFMFSFLHCENHVTTYIDNSFSLN